MKTNISRKITYVDIPPSQTPLFVKRAERAFKVVAKQVRAEAKLHGLKPLEWKD
jgi:hypothetical protein